MLKPFFFFFEYHANAKKKWQLLVISYCADEFGIMDLLNTSPYFTCRVNEKKFFLNYLSVV